MFERFTDRARKVMTLANQEAHRLNHDYVNSEHILLGLVKEGSGIAASVLKNLNCSLRDVRLGVEKFVKAKPETVVMGRLPQSAMAKMVINKAVEAARSLGHNYVGTEHLLLGLLATDGGIHHKVLESLGVKTEEARKEVKYLTGVEDSEEGVKNIEVTKQVRDVLEKIHKLLATHDASLAHDLRRIID